MLLVDERQIFGERGVEGLDVVLAVERHVDVEQPRLHLQVQPHVRQEAGGAGESFAQHPIGGSEIGKLTGHTSWVNAIAFAPKEKLLASAKELIAKYGQKRGSSIEFAEVFEISEYAAPLEDGARLRLFGFLPNRTSRLTAPDRKSVV